MQNGITFNGVHSSTLAGVTVRTRDRPVMPAPKLAAYEADNMSGDIDFTDYTGETYYQNRTVTVDFKIIGDGLSDLQNKMNAVMVWCRGKGRIRFDDMPAVIWIGRVSDSVSYLPEHGGHTALLTVSFLCEPFTRFLHDAFDGVKLGDMIRLSAPIPIGASEYHTRDIVLRPDIQSQIYIMGDAPVRPVLKMTISEGAWSFEIWNSLGAYEFKFSQALDPMTMDCARQEVYRTEPTGNTQQHENYMPYMSGDFPVLTPGHNQIIRNNCTFELHYIPQFFYNGGMS